MSVELLGEQLAAHDVGILGVFLVVIALNLDGKANYLELPVMRRVAWSVALLAVGATGWMYVEGGVTLIIKTVADNVFSALIVGAIIAALWNRDR